MPANLPPQYWVAEKKLKQARSSEEKIFILERMLTLAPKHKGTERLQMDLKAKIAKLRKGGTGKKKGQKETHFFIDKEGAGQLAIVGPPNSGKSSLLNCLTNAKAKTGDFPFVTKFPQPAMMPFEDIFIQLIDNPPLTGDFFPPWLREILFWADGLLVVFSADKPKEADDFMEILAKAGMAEKKMIIIANKMDLEESRKNLDFFEEKYRPEFLSCRQKEGIENLKKRIFGLLEIIRVYSKKPSQAAELGSPFTCPKGSSLIEVAGQIHLDFAENFKYARLFKKGLKSPLIVGKDYVLQDGDIIEIHS